MRINQDVFCDSFFTDVTQFSGQMKFRSVLVSQGVSLPWGRVRLRDTRSKPLRIIKTLFPQDGKVKRYLGCLVYRSGHTFKMQTKRVYFRVHDEKFNIDGHIDVLKQKRLRRRFSVSIRILSFK